MNTLERVTAALTPGSAFNSNNLVWRSLSSLMAYSGCKEEAELLDLLDGGDLDRPVVFKPSTKGKGLLVAFKDLVQDPDIIKVVAGNAVAPEPEAKALEEEKAEEGEEVLF